MTSARVAVVGSINMDVAVRVATLPLPGETVPGDDAVLSLGGKGANQAVAAARLGASVALIGRVGRDPFGDAAIAALAAEGIDPGGVIPTDGAATGVALITIGGGGQNMITLSPGANARLSPADVFDRARALSDCDILLLQNEVPGEAAHAAIQLARREQCLVICDPAPAQGYDPMLIASADIITPNETEASQLTGIAVIDGASGLAAARRLVAMGARAAVVKLGARGVVFSGAEGEGAVEAPSVIAIDTVAAGDCFNGALAVALAERRSGGLREALIYACRAAAHSVTRQGASRSMPLRADLA
jgi:ribokinase